MKMTAALSDRSGEVPKEKPPLAVIANMPFPVSMLTMRRHYHKDWHKPEPDGESVGKWKVEVAYTYTDTEHWSCEVEAVTETEAKAKAEKQFDDVHRWEKDVEIIEIEAEFEEVA